MGVVPNEKQDKITTESNGETCSDKREYATTCNDQNCPGKLTQVEKHSYSNDKCLYLIFEIWVTNTKKKL